MLQAPAQPPRVRALTALSVGEGGGDNSGLSRNARLPGLTFTTAAHEAWVPRSFLFSPAKVLWKEAWERSEERGRRGRRGAPCGPCRSARPSPIPAPGGRGAGGEGLRRGATCPLPARLPPSDVKQSLCFLFKTLASGAIIGKEGSQALLSMRIH